MGECRELEHRLHRCLSGKAAQVRQPGADLAGRALRSGRRRRRLHSLSGLVTVIAATVIAGAGLLHVLADPPSSQLGFVHLPSAETANPAVLAPEDAAADPPTLAAPAGVVGTATDGRPAVATGDGAADSLHHLTDVVSAHQVARGWTVVAGNHDRFALWWVTAQRPAPVLVLGRVDALAVDRSRVAWRRGSVLSAARLSVVGELAQVVETEVPERVDPVSYVGDSVLLAHVDEDGEVDGWGTWQPAGGQVPQEWARDVAGVFGALPDAGTAVGLVPVAGEPCLAQLDLEDDLAVDQTACLSLLPRDMHLATLSPDGRWLFGAASEDAENQVPVLVDVAAAFDAAGDAAVWEVAGPVPVGRPAWPEPGLVLYPTVDGVARVWPERVAVGAPDAVQTIPVPGDPVVVAQIV